MPKPYLSTQSQKKVSFKVSKESVVNSNPPLIGLTNLVCLKILGIPLEKVEGPSSYFLTKYLENLSIQELIAIFFEKIQALQVTEEEKAPVASYFIDFLTAEKN